MFVSEILKRKLARLDQQLTPLREELNRLNFEAEKWAENRTVLHNRIRRLKEEAASLRQKRDSLNRNVHDLKRHRERAKADCRARQAQALKLNEKMQEHLKRRPSQDMKSIQRQIKALDWQIQTRSLSLEEERVLVDRVRAFERDLSVHKTIEKLKERLVILREEERALESKARNHHNKISRLAQQSQQFHKELHEILSQILTFQKKADDAHQRFLAAKQQVQKPSQEWADLQFRIKSLRQELRQIEETKEAQRRQGLQKELEERAKKKLKRGEKLTWEEFKALSDQGIV